MQCRSSENRKCYSWCKCWHLGLLKSGHQVIYHKRMLKEWLNIYYGYSEKLEEMLHKLDALRIINRQNIIWIIHTVSWDGTEYMKVVLQIRFCEKGKVIWKMKVCWLKLYMTWNSLEKCESYVQAADRFVLILKYWSSISDINILEGLFWIFMWYMLLPFFCQ